VDGLQADGVSGQVGGLAADGVSGKGSKMEEWVQRSTRIL
jgi:hypothetical protein